jgi:hypothetical protein
MFRTLNATISFTKQTFSTCKKHGYYLIVIQKNAPLIIMQSSITETIHHLKAFQNHYKAKTKEEFRYLFMKTLIFL